MIEIHFNWAIAIYLSLAICLVLGLWIFYNYHEEPKEELSDNLMQCAFCGHIFHNYQKAEIVSCPMCKSYLTEGNIQKPVKNNETDKSAEK